MKFAVVSVARDSVAKYRYETGHQKSVTRRRTATRHSWSALVRRRDPRDGAVILSLACPGSHLRYIGLDGSLV